MANFIYTVIINAMSVLCYSWTEKLQVLKWSPVQTQEGLTVEYCMKS